MNPALWLERSALRSPEAPALYCGRECVEGEAQARALDLGTGSCLSVDRQFAQSDKLLTQGVPMALSYLRDVDTVSAQDAALYAAPMSHGAGLY